MNHYSFTFISLMFWFIHLISLFDHQNIQRDNHNLILFINVPFIVMFSIFILLMFRFFLNRLIAIINKVQLFLDINIIPEKWDTCPWVVVVMKYGTNNWKIRFFLMIWNGWWRSFGAVTTSVLYSPWTWQHQIAGTKERFLESLILSTTISNGVIATHETGVWGFGSSNSRQKFIQGQSWERCVKAETGGDSKKNIKEEGNYII